MGKPKEAKSVFNGLQKTVFSSPFGSSTSAFGNIPVSAAAKRRDAKAKATAIAKAKKAGYGVSGGGGLTGTPVQLRQYLNSWPGASNYNTLRARVLGGGGGSVGKGAITNDVLQQFGYTPLSTPTGKQLTTDMRFNPQLNNANNAIQAGLTKNYQFLNQTPDQQYTNATSGNNPLYNILKEELARKTEEALGRALVDARMGGLTNSTTAGALRSGIMNESLLNNNKNLLSAIEFGNEQSRANIGAQLQGLSGLSNLLYPLSSASNANLMQGMTGIDSTNINNTQAYNNYLQRQQDLDTINKQNKSSMWGNLLGSAVSLLPVGGQFLKGLF